MPSTKFLRTSLILSIISVAFSVIECWMVTVFIGMILGILSIVFALVSKKKENTNPYNEIILGSCGIIVSLIWLIMIII